MTNRYRLTPEGLRILRSRWLHDDEDNISLTNRVYSACGYAAKDMVGIIISRKPCIELFPCIEHLDDRPKDCTCWKLHRCCAKMVERRFLMEVP